MYALPKVADFVFAAVLLLVPANCFAVLVVQGFTAARHDRFANDSDLFLGSTAVTGLAQDADLSGVARAEGGSWATLLKNPSGGSPTHFLSADHSQPSGIANFFPGNDPLATPVSCTITGGEQLGTTDIWIGTLDVSAPSCDTSLVTGYEVAFDNANSHVGDIVFQAGVSNQNYDTVNQLKTTNMRFGRNAASVLETGTFIGRTGDFMIYQDDSADGDLLAPLDPPDPMNPDLSPDETLFRGGDSGGPSFLVDGTGALQLFGIHSFTGFYETNDVDGDGVVDVDDDGNEVLTPTRRISGDAYLPRSRSLILAEITAVPEPSSASCLLTLVLAAFVSRCVGTAAKNAMN